MMKQVQKGFTLIELMIVVAIIGILAAIALPAYQDYTIRSKVTEGMIAASACKTGVSEFIQANGRLPTNSDEAGCAQTTKYVTSVTVGADAAISVLLRGTGNAAVDGTNLILQPTSNAARTAVISNTSLDILGWSCGTSAAATAFKYFPASCRQVVLTGL